MARHPDFRMRSSCPPFKVHYTWFQFYVSVKKALLSRESAISGFAEQAGKSDEDDVPADQQDQKVEHQPPKSRPPERKPIPGIFLEEEHVQEPGCGMGRDEEAEHNADYPIGLIRSGQRAKIIEQSDVSEAKRRRTEHHDHASSVHVSFCPFSMRIIYIRPVGQSMTYCGCGPIPWAGLPSSLRQSGRVKPQREGLTR